MPKGKPDPALYQVRKETLALFERQAEQGNIALYYLDESKVSEEGYVPYGWQFADEQVGMPVSKGQSINCLGMISRDNRFMYKLSKENITAQFVLEGLEEFSLGLNKPAVVVMDNARVHTARKIKERLCYWQKRGLYIFYLPAYSPQLNIIERLWKELKSRWLRPSDYQTADQLFYALHLALAAVGRELKINFSTYSF
jgi:transposase